ncbi:MAG: hypothetical protein WC465_01395 [Patescibacteria group bacterium]
MSLLKKIFTSAVVMTTILWSVGAGFVSTAQAAGSYPAGSLLALQGQKGAAVYIVMDNGTKKVFPSTKEYFTWYTNFDKVVRVPVTELDKYPDGGAVGLRPGTKLVTHMNTAKIYAVEPNSVIRWIPDASTASTLYGSDWAKKVYDVIPGFFSSTYTVGTDLSSTYPTGTLVKSGSTTYYIDGSTKRPFAGTGFADNNFNTADVITVTDLSAYTDGTSITSKESALAGLTSSTPTPGNTGGVTVSLAADTPASGMVVSNSARAPFTKLAVTTGSQAATIDTMIVKRGGIGQDGAFSSVDVLDASTNLPLDTNSKTFNSNHEATFTKDITIPANTTKYLILSGNMGTLTDYAGEAPALGVSSITLTGGGTVSGTLPIYGNTQTLNATITIGSATVSRGSYLNATSTALEVGKTDYTFTAFQIQAGSAEDVTLKQMSAYQIGTASLTSDLNNWELLRDGTKIADGVVDTSNSKYINFILTSPLTIPKGQTYQFQIRADVESGSARTVQVGFYRRTDILVQGQTYGYNITPTTSGTGTSASATTNPVFWGNTATISSGTMTVERSNTVTATNITVGNDQTLGAFKFTVKGEPIDVTALTLTITSSSGSQIEDALQAVKLVDANGKTLAGPTDLTALTVPFTDTFTLPVGDTVVKVVGNLSTNGGWATNDTIYASLNTPASKIIATGQTTGDAITPTTASQIDTNTQTVKAAYLTVTRNTLPSSNNVIKGAQDVLLGSWNFDATNSGENIRITSLVFAASSTEVSNLTVYDGVYGSGGVAKSPINDAPTAGDGQSSTFAFDDPIIITKGTNRTIQLVGDINSAATTNQSSEFGLTDTNTTANASVLAYGVSTGNRATLALTADNGAVLTYSAGGSITISTSNNPTNGFVRAGATGVTFGSIKLDAQYEPIDVTVLKIFTTDGGLTGTATGNYQDVTQLYVYDGTKVIASGPVSSNGYITFNLDRGVLTVQQDQSKILTIKADIGTINQNLDNAPATPAADVRFGIGGTDGITAIGNSSNATVSTETYNGSTTSSMIIHKAIPTVTYSQSGNVLGAATAMVNGASDVFAYKVAADANGSEVLLYRTSFEIATGGDGAISVSSCYVKDSEGNTVGASTNLTDVDATTAGYVSYVFDNPTVSAGDTKEALMISPGASMTYKLNCTIATAGTGDNLSVSMLGDTASSTPAASFGTPAAAGQNLADAWGTMNQGNFVWSDNFKNRGLATDGSNATAYGQWYNGYLVSGLGANTTGTAYVIGWSS